MTVLYPPSPPLRLDVIAGFFDFLSSYLVLTSNFSPTPTTSLLVLYSLSRFHNFSLIVLSSFAQLTYPQSARYQPASVRSVVPLFAVHAPLSLARHALRSTRFAQVLIGARPLHAHDPMGVIWSTVSTRWLDHHRSLSIAVSMGPISPAKRREDAHLLDLHGNIPTFSALRRQSARRQHPRRDHSRSRRVLCHGSRLRRFRSTLLLHTLLGIFRLRTKECLLNVAIHIRWTTAPACAPITPSS